MGLLEDLKEIPIKERTCTIAEMLTKVTQEERNALLWAIDQVRCDERYSRAKRYSSQWLADVLRNNGYPVSRSTVSRHVNGECSCERTG